MWYKKKKSRIRGWDEREEKKEEIKLVKILTNMIHLILITCPSSHEGGVKHF